MPYRLVQMEEGGESFPFGACRESIQGGVQPFGPGEDLASALL
jgi:hypothetical protein